MLYILQVLPFYILQLCSGLSLGFPGILIPQLKESNSTVLEMDDSTKGWIVSLDYGMTTIIALVAGQLQSMLGPKRISLLACFPVCASWALMATAPNIITIYVSRILVGLGNGIITSSVYIAEVVKPEDRGSIIMVEAAFRISGTILVYSLGAFIGWKTIAWMALPLPVVSFIYGLFIPESPIYLAQKRGYQSLDDEENGRRDGSSNNKSTYSNPADNSGDSSSDNDDITSLKSKDSSNESSTNSSSSSPFLSRVGEALATNFGIFQRRDVVIPMSLLFVVLVAQQCSAMKVMQGYAVEIFSAVFQKESGGLEDDGAIDQDAYYSAVIMGCVRLVSTLLVARFIRNFGRKSMYILSAVLTTVFLVLFGVIDYFDFGVYWRPLPILVISAQVFSLQLGLQSFPSLLSAELFPNDVRAKCKGIVRAVSSLFSFAMLKIFPYLESHFGLYGSFWVLASVLAASLPIIFCFVPEAKDVSLDFVSRFFDPVTTQFYALIASDGYVRLPSAEESSNRIHMIENSFGTAGKLLFEPNRLLLGEGMLQKGRHGSDKSRERHFFLFNDCLVWGKIIKQNINYIRQRRLSLLDIELEDVPGTRSWLIITPDRSFRLEAATQADKIQWMVLLLFAKMNYEFELYQHSQGNTEMTPIEVRHQPIIATILANLQSNNRACAASYQACDGLILP